MVSFLYWYLLGLFDGIVFCRAFNFFESFKRNRRIHGRICRYCADSGLYSIQDNTGCIFLARKLRIVRYLEGVFPKMERLFQDYTGGLVSISSGDIVIDCGANVGEFSLFCIDRGAFVYAFEPDPVENSALHRNLTHSSSVSRLALWEDCNGVDFFLANNSGDSGAFSSYSKEGKIRVETITLNKIICNICSARPGMIIHLLKLEAEGAEPEILKGGMSVLKYIRYIAADLGPERGEELENTAPPVINTLLGSGFNLIYYCPGRSIFLFENKHFSMF